MFSSLTSQNYVRKVGHYFLGNNIKMDTFNILIFKLRTKKAFDIKIMIYITKSMYYFNINMY